MNDYRDLLNALMMQQRRRYAAGGAVAPAAASGVPAPTLAGAGAPVATPTQSQAMASMPAQGSAVGTLGAAPATSAQTPGWYQNYMGVINAPQGTPAPIAQTATPPNGATPMSALTNAVQQFGQSQQFGTAPMASLTPTQPGFMPQQGMPQGGMFGQGFPQNFNPQGAPMGGLNMFGQNNPMRNWRDMRPDRQPGMDQGQFRQQMEAWRAQRPNFSAMPQPSSSPFPNAMPSDGPNYRPVEQNLTPSQQAAMEQERLRQNTYQSQNNYFAPSAGQLALNSAMYGNNSQPNNGYAPDLDLPNGFGRPPIQQQG